MKILTLLTTFIIAAINAFAVGMIGGGFEDSGETHYVAIISSSGVATPISGSAFPQGNRTISSLAMNASGSAIIGGMENGAYSGTPYIALISPSGISSRISGYVPKGSIGRINSVAINDAGSAIAVGVHQKNDADYMALISPKGIAKAVSGTLPILPANIHQASINNQGVALVGGAQKITCRSTTPNLFYLAFISPHGIATPIKGAVPKGAGHVDAVAINDHGAGIVGGYQTSELQDTPYIAMISKEGLATEIKGDLPKGLGNIYAVAINSDGRAVVGGLDNDFTSPYAVVISKDGVATAISDEVPKGFGEIRTVAINKSGTSIIGGFENSLPYAAFVSPNGAATTIYGEIPTTDGIINTVAINDVGYAIIGGRENNFKHAYAALVSPSGIATRITGFIPDLGSIEASSLRNFFFDQVVPQNYGPGASYANALFTLSDQVLPNHHYPFFDLPDSCPCPDESKKSSCKDTADLVLWASPFGTYAHNKAEQTFPSMTNWIGGMMVGFDYRGLPNTMIGIGTAYAFNRANFDENCGHANTHQEFLTLYGSWERKYLVLEGSIWGGLYQMENKRISLGTIDSKAHINGFLLSPHLGLSVPINIKGDTITLSPFTQLDFVSNWQGKVRETGASGFNMRIGSHYTSMLRTELGLKFLEVLKYSWGNIILVQKGSYVNKKPFSTHPQHAYFAGGTSSFDVKLFPGELQNLGVVSLGSQFVPCSNKHLYGSINYQGEFGSKFQSHSLVFEIGKRF